MKYIKNILALPFLLIALILVMISRIFGWIAFLTQLEEEESWSVNCYIIDTLVQLTEHH